MKSFINKVLIVAGLMSLVPFFSYAAVSCSPVYENDLVGKTVNISANITGGTGTSYDYSWSGDDGLTGSGNSISHVYSGEGSMTINVTASSTDSSDYFTGSCSVNIYTDNTIPTDFSASCVPDVNQAVIGQPITWRTSIQGALGLYSIKWLGDELDNSSFNSAQNYTVSYTTSGIKSATMQSFQSRYGSETPLYNAKLSTNIACDATVDIATEELHNPSSIVITGTCSPSQETFYTNEDVTWTSNLNISGGLQPYLMTWIDADGSVIGTGTSTIKSYSTAGTRTPYLRIEDDAGQSSRVTCESVTIRNRSGNGNGNNNNSTSTATSTSRTATSTATSTNSTGTSTSNVSTSTSGTNGNNNGNGNGNNNGNGNTGSNNGYNVFPGYIFTTNQYPRTYGEAIANLQSRLKNEGLYNGLIGGFFGPATEEALKDYQRVNGLAVTGILDDATRAKLNGATEGGTLSSNDKAPSKLSGLTASVLEAFGSAYKFIKVNLGAIIFFLLIIVIISQIVMWLRVLKKENK